MTIIHVCAWCGREIAEDGAPGEKYVPDCNAGLVSHGACNECLPGARAEIAAFREKVKQRKEKVLCR
jgi:hypothetical protein